MTVPAAGAAARMLTAGTDGAVRTLAATSNPSAGPLGLAIVVLLVIALVFLSRSLMKHLGRVPQSFEPPEAKPEANPETKPDAEEETQAGEPVIREGPADKSTP